MEMPTAVSPPQQRDADQQRGEDRQVQRHHEVLEHEDRQHHGRLAVAEAAEVGEDLGDDPGRRDVGDARHHERADRPPAEDQRDGGAGRRVEHDVEHARDPGAPQAGEQLVRRVLQAQQEQQEDHADLGGEAGEVADVAQRDEPTGTEGEPAEQVQRDRRHPDPLRQPPQQAEPEEDGTEFDELEGGVRHARSAVLEDLGGVAEPLPRADGDEQITCASMNSGPGEGCTCPARITATSDTPVRVRIAVSPSGRPSNGDPSLIGSCLVRMPGRSRCSSASCATSCGAPSRLASAPASS